MLSPKGSKDSNALLRQALLSLQTPEEVDRFLQDALTMQEVQSIAQRVEVAWLLRKGMTYQEISRETGASTATITRVNRSLRYGAEGYTLVLQRIENENEHLTESTDAECGDARKTHD